MVSNLFIDGMTVKTSNITNNILHPLIVKYIEKNPGISKPCYSTHLPALWPFIISRFHCFLKTFALRLNPDCLYAHSEFHPLGPFCKSVGSRNTMTKIHLVTDTIDSNL